MPWFIPSSPATASGVRSVTVGPKSGWVHDCDSGGLFSSEPQAFTSVQVRDWVLFVQVLQAVHVQFSVQVPTQDWEVEGLFNVVPHEDKSVQLRDWDPREH
ncbi:MAG: hypothetical protein AAB518_00165 [Patescibacteria group bacterium]